MIFAAIEILLVILICLNWWTGWWKLRRVVNVIGVFAGSRRRQRGQSVSFFHPHAEDGGGGERLLWSAIIAVNKAFPQCQLHLLTNKGFDETELKRRARHNFNLQVDAKLHIIPLDDVHLLDPVNYPYCTLLLQSLAGALVPFLSPIVHHPAVLIDTNGWAFCYPLYWALGAKVACYVHYPTISTDMLSRVHRRRSLYNNRDVIAQSFWLSNAKLLYYQMFAMVYGIVGQFSDVTMVNSTWTQDHIRDIWRREATLVYPPVNTDALAEIAIEGKTRHPWVISIGQFRPEKNHGLQLRAYARAVRRSREEGDSRVRLSKLIVVGSCRNEADEKRLESLREMTCDLGIAQNVDFYDNVPFGQLRELLSGSVAGLHTMTDEHFGIGIVEYMAAGVIPIAHNSGGPKKDILATNKNDPSAIGFLRETEEEYTEAITEVLGMSEERWEEWAKRCRQRAQKFSETTFDNGFIASLKPLLQS